MSQNSFYDGMLGLPATSQTDPGAYAQGKAIAQMGTPPASSSTVGDFGPAYVGRGPAGESISLPVPPPRAIRLIVALLLIANGLVFLLLEASIVVPRLLEYGRLPASATGPSGIAYNVAIAIALVAGWLILPKSRQIAGKAEETDRPPVEEA